MKNEVLTVFMHHLTIPIIFHCKNEKKERKNSFHDKFSVPNRLWNWNLDGSLNEIIYIETWDQGQGSVIFKTLLWFQSYKSEKKPCYNEKFIVFKPRLKEKN